MKWQELTRSIAEAAPKLVKAKPHQRDEKGNMLMNECLSKWNLDGGMSCFELLERFCAYF